MHHHLLPLTLLLTSLTSASHNHNNNNKNQNNPRAVLTPDPSLSAAAAQNGAGIRQPLNPSAVVAAGVLPSTVTPAPGDATVFSILPLSIPTALDADRSPVSIAPASFLSGTLAPGILADTGTPTDFAKSTSVASASGGGTTATGVASTSAEATTASGSMRTSSSSAMGARCTLGSEMAWSGFLGVGAGAAAAFL